MQCLKALGITVSAGRRLLVNGNELVPVGPQHRHPLLEAAPEQSRVDPVDQDAQPELARNAVMELREPPQEVELMLALDDNVVEIAHDAIVPHVTISRTSFSGHMTRQGSRSSSSSEKCSSSPSRARDISSSRIVTVIGAMIALHAGSEHPGNHPKPQNHPKQRPLT